MITKEELSKKLEESLKQAKSGDLNAIQQSMFDHLKFMFESYNSLTPDAQEVADNMMEIIQKHIGDVLEKLPDSKQKRLLRRYHAGSLGKRVLVEEMIKDLESPPELEEENSKQFRAIFICRLQNITDFLFDICSNTVTGPTNFVQISLFGMCVTEFLVTFHLAQHYYTNQAYSHIRTIIEHKDKIELFRQKPEWAEIWCSEDLKKIRRELSPARVREKLGKPKYDPFYTFLSTLGPHSTFQAVQAKTFVQVEPIPKEKPQIRQWFGGCPAEHHIIFVNGGALYALHLVLLQLLKSFSNFINEEEGIEVLKQSAVETVDYFKKNFLPWAKENHWDTKNLENVLNSDSWRNL